MENHVWSPYELRYYKTNKMSVRPAKTQISLGIRPVWSVFSVRMKKAWILSYPLSAQRRLRSAWASRSSLGARSFCWFCHEVAHISLLATESDSRPSWISARGRAMVVEIISWSMSTKVMRPGWARTHDPWINSQTPRDAAGSHGIL